MIEVTTDKAKKYLENTIRGLQCSIACEQAIVDTHRDIVDNFKTNYTPASILELSIIREALDSRNRVTRAQEDIKILQFLLEQIT